MAAPANPKLVFKNLNVANMTAFLTTADVKCAQIIEFYPDRLESRGFPPGNNFVRACHVPSKDLLTYEGFPEQGVVALPLVALKKVLDVLKILAKDSKNSVNGSIDYTLDGQQQPVGVRLSISYGATKVASKAQDKMVADFKMTPQLWAKLSDVRQHLGRFDISAGLAQKLRDLSDLGLDSDSEASNKKAVATFVLRVNFAAKTLTFASREAGGWSVEYQPEDGNLHIDPTGGVPPTGDLLVPRRFLDEISGPLTVVHLTSVNSKHVLIAQSTPTCVSFTALAPPAPTA